ncbi:MAG: hypothetical protein IPL46_18515 [Saprospiraceae bacterium]|nr:hypothetical protein [Saprospiraceae bacterium]
MKNWSQIFVFSLILLMPVLGSLSGISDKILTSSEQRILAKFPIFKYSAISTYIDQVDDWYKDNFGFRNTFFRAYSYFKYHILKVSPLPERLMVGKKGWLYYGSTNVVKDLQGKLPFSIGNLEKIKENLEAKDHWLKKQGVQFYLAVAPGKYSVCKVNLPSYLQKESVTTRLDQLITYLSKESSIKMIDLKTKIPQDSSGCTYFQKTDSHWNHYGAFLGSVHLLEQIQIDYPSIKVPNLTDYDFRAISTDQRGFSRMINLTIKEEFTMLNPKKPLGYKEEDKRNTVPAEYRFRQELYEVRFRAIDQNSSNLKIMFSHDSFIYNMQKFINESFDEAVYFRRDENMQWWDEKLIMVEKPNILVLELIESHLPLLLSPAFSN